MTEHEQLQEAMKQPEAEENTWTPEAWVYFIWVVIGHRVYCKIGYSADPVARLSQITGGIPERPFQIYLLPCLDVEQAKVFESMLHSHLQKVRAKGEWFSHNNVKHLYRTIGAEVEMLLALFKTFGYETELQQIDLRGRQPVLYDNGIFSHSVE